MLSAMVLLLMMAAIFWPAYRITRPAAASPAPSAAPSPGPAGAARVDVRRDVRPPAPEEPAMRVSRLEDYVQQGLVDLRIMLVQAARRRHDRQDRG